MVESRSNSSLCEKGNIAQQIGPYSTTQHYFYNYQPLMSSTKNLTNVGVMSWMKCNVTGQEKDGNMRPPRGVREKEDYRQAGRT